MTPERVWPVFNEGKTESRHSESVQRWSHDDLESQICIPVCLSIPKSNITRKEGRKSGRRKEDKNGKKKKGRKRIENDYCWVCSKTGNKYKMAFSPFATL